MVPFGIDCKVVEFVNHGKQELLVFFRGRVGAKHVVSVASAVRPQPGDVALKADQQVEFVSPPQTVPRVVAFALLTS